MKLKSILASSISLFLLAATAPVSATTGYFALSYWPKSSSMAGAVVAAPQDATIAAVNPAGIGLVGERVDVSLMLFSPIREASLGTSQQKSSRDFFVIPNGGVSYKINDKASWGVSVYSNGGMNTTYSRNLYDEAMASVMSGGLSKSTGLPDTGELMIDMGQMIFAPTLSYQVTPNHTFGISALLGVQYFKAKGLGNFQCFTRTGATQNGPACAPGNAGPLTPGFKASSDLTDNGYDFSYGAGVRLGWVGKIHPMITLGIAGSSPIYMTEFNKYSELFAEQGGFDIPANFTTGIALHPVSNLLVAFDYQRIFYGSVNSVGNKGPTPTPQGPGFPAGHSYLGDKSGIGFGWNDINVYRLGLQYQYNPAWTFSAGYSWNDQPFKSDQLLFNVISPAVNTKHVTFGIGYSPDKYSEWNLSYQHAFKDSVSSNQTALGVPGSVSMYQNSIELGYSWKF
ncbi:MAG: hypothetical protein GQ532_12250 [Methylomarinum sp.]|nr:hypothetical protein [Methylomarinum sp.]